MSEVALGRYSYCGSGKLNRNGLSRGGVGLVEEVWALCWRETPPPGG
jgi:hypothetical protein